jgi:hypothetical protein
VVQTGKAQMLARFSPQMQKKTILHSPFSIAKKKSLYYNKTDLLFVLYNYTVFE